MIGILITDVNPKEDERSQTFSLGIYIFIYKQILYVCIHVYVYIYMIYMYDNMCMYICIFNIF
jgi:hypothetical protein